MDEAKDDLDEAKDKIEDLDDDIDDLKDDLKEMEEDKEDDQEDTMKKIDELITKKRETKEKKEKKERLEKEIFEKARLEKVKAMKIKKDGYENYLRENEIVNISKNEFAMFNVNWFKVCCGLESYDELFESEVMERIREKGIKLNPKDIISKIKRLFEDEKEEKIFYKMIKSRIISCSEIKESNIFEKIFTSRLGSFKNCDKREEDSILYLYDEYRAFLNRDLDVKLNRLDRVLILLFCETRQELLSKYIGLETIRQIQTNEFKDSNIKYVLDQIMDADSNRIEENDKKLEKMKNSEYDDFKEEEMEKAEKKSNIEKMMKERELKKKIKNKSTLDNIKDDLEDKVDEKKAEKDQKKRSDRDIKLTKLSMEERKERFEEELDDVAGDKQRRRDYLDNKNLVDNVKEMIDKKFKSDKGMEVDEINLNLNPEEEEALNRAVKSGRIQSGGADIDGDYELSDERVKKLCDELHEDHQLKERHLEVIDKCK